MQGVVDTFFGDEFFMRADFCDHSVVENEYSIGFLNSLQAMCDQYRSSTGRQLTQRILYQQLRFRIDTCCGFVEDEDFWVCS